MFTCFGRFTVKISILCLQADKYFDTIYYTCLKIEGKKKFKHITTDPFDETNKCKKNKGAITVW